MLRREEKALDNSGPGSGTQTSEGGGTGVQRAETRVHRLLPLFCFLLFVVVYGLTSHDEASASDEIASFGTGISLATRHNLVIDQLKSVQKITPLGAYGRGDHLYSKYFPGTAISTAVLYTLTARPDDSPYRTPNATYSHAVLADSETGARVALAVNAVLGALGMSMLFMLLDSVYGLPAAIITTLLMGFTTDWWYESQLFYLEVGAGTFLIGALLFARRGNPWLSSAMLAIALLFRPVSIVGLPICLLAAWKKRPGPAGWLSLLPLAAGPLILGVYNYVRFRSLFNFGYGGESFTTPLLSGLAAILLSPGRSFLVFSPVVLLGVYGAWRLWKSDRTLALLCIGVVGGCIVAAAMWHDPFGGKVWGTRLALPAIPIAGVLVGAAVQAAYSTRRAPLIGLIVLLAAWGLFIQVASVLQDPAIALRNALDSGYARTSDVSWSLTKNWVALEIRSLRAWEPCNTGAYAIRELIARCGG